MALLHVASATQKGVLQPYHQAARNLPALTSASQPAADPTLPPLAVWSPYDPIVSPSLSWEACISSTVIRHEQIVLSLVSGISTVASLLRNGAICHNFCRRTRNVCRQGRHQRQWSLGRRFHHEPHLARQNRGRKRLGDCRRLQSQSLPKVRRQPLGHGEQFLGSIEQAEHS